MKMLNIISKLPFRLMYKQVWFDLHKIWIPRFGWSKKQIRDAEKQSKELYENIIWK